MSIKTKIFKNIVRKFCKIYVSNSQTEWMKGLLEPWKTTIFFDKSIFMVLRWIQEWNLILGISQISRDFSDFSGFSGFLTVGNWFWHSSRSWSGGSSRRATSSSFRKGSSGLSRGQASKSKWKRLIFSPWCWCIAGLKPPPHLHPSPPFPTTLKKKVKKYLVPKWLCYAPCLWVVGIFLKQEDTKYLQMRLTASDSK